MFLIPNYLTIAQLKWIGKIQGVIASGLSEAFGVFFMRQFFMGCPRNWKKHIDGAGILRTFWNDYLWLLLILCGSHKALTLPVVAWKDSDRIKYSVTLCLRD
jgi:ABC-type glycerol-3-phosphate transport system permease component